MWKKCGRGAAKCCSEGPRYHKEVKARESFCHIGTEEVKACFARSRPGLLDNLTPSYQFNMSSYEDYDTVSEYYDNGRKPAGVELYSTIIQGFLKKSFGEVHLLDAGCGTGNYSKAFLENGVGKVSVMDASEGMLSKAKEKLNQYLKDSRVGDVVQGQLPDIPFSESNFDVVTFVQVLQHLDKPFEGFPNLKAVLKEGLRVLKPGGLLLINHCTHDQLRYGSWYRNLLPHSVEKQCDRYMPVNELISFLEGLGFINATIIVCPWDHVIDPEQYFNKDGPFNESWRKMESVWKLAEIEGELQTALKSLKEKKDFEMLDDWFEQVEEKRKHVGITTGIFVQKPKTKNE